MTTKQITDLPSATTANDNDLLLKRDDGANADQALSIQTLKSEAFGNAVDENAAVTATPDTLAKRDALGRIQAASGGSGNETVVHNDAAVSANANTIAKRDSSGRVKTDDGGSGTDAVNHNDLDELDTVPAGAVMYFAMDSAPDGWLKANGATISRTTFSALFAAIGTTFGTGDGSSTFELPDLRGEFIRGWDDGRGVDSGRSFGSDQADEFKSHTHDVGCEQDSSDNTGYPMAGGADKADFIAKGAALAEGGDETRPRNVALLACIKF